MKFNGLTEMELCLKLAKKAASEGEIPVGAVIVSERGEIISQKYNKVEDLRDPIAHAEMLAIKEAAEKIGDKRLEGCTIYVSLEPCPMCAQAISFARIAKLVYAAADIKGGGVENGARIFQQDSCFHKPEVVSGMMGEESEKLIKEFFSDLRNKDR